MQRGKTPKMKVDEGFEIVMARVALHDFIGAKNHLDVIREIARTNLPLLKTYVSLLNHWDAAILFSESKNMSAQRVVANLVPLVGYWSRRHPQAFHFSATHHGGLLREEKVENRSHLSPSF